MTDRPVKVFYEWNGDEYIAIGSLPHKDALSEAQDLGYLTIRKDDGHRYPLMHIPWHRVVRIET